MASTHMHGHLGARVYGAEFVQDIHTCANGAIYWDGKGSS